MALLRDLPELDLKAGDAGAVVHCYNGKGHYEVEFVSLPGETIAVATIAESDLRPTGPRDVAHARAVA